MANEKKVEKITPSGKNRVPTDWVETAAYFHWEKRGRPHGDAWADWLEAEHEIREWLEATGALKPSSPTPAPAPTPPAKKIAPKKFKLS
jgi:hypothetical protein